MPPLAGTLPPMLKGLSESGGDARERRSGIKVVRTGIGAEKPWVLAAALAVAIAVLLLLPPRFRLGPSWLVPAAEALLLAAILVADRSRGQHRSGVVRALSFVLVFVLTIAAAFVTGRLLVDLVEGGPETNSAADLLEVAAGVWLYTIIAFVFLYWLADGRGPEARIWDPPEFPDLAFPQQLNPNTAPPGWRPEFPDYLYLGFTNATAFSPTDVMPLSRWGKLAMTVQAAASLAILGLVVARATSSGNSAAPAVSQARWHRRGLWLSLQKSSSCDRASTGAASACREASASGGREIEARRPANLSTVGSTAATLRST
jgi:hypothetical protein